MLVVETVVVVDVVGQGSVVDGQTGQSQSVVVSLTVAVVVVG